MFDQNCDGIARAGAELVLMSVDFPFLELQEGPLDLQAANFA